MIPFVGPSSQLRRKKADTQRTVNMYPSFIESGSGKAQMFLKPIPGLRQFGTASLDILKEQAAATITVGGTQTYTVTVTNTGPGIASGSIITEQIPEGFTFGSCSIAYTGGAEGPATATSAELLAGITITTWPLGGTVVMTVVGTYETAGTYTNTAVIAVFLPPTVPGGPPVPGPTKQSTVVTEVEPLGETGIAWDAVDKSPKWGTAGEVASLTGVLSGDPAYGVKLDTYRNTGKRYLELVIDSLTMSGFEKEDMCFALVNAAWDVDSSSFPGNSPNAWVRLRSAYVQHNGGETANGAAQDSVDANGDVLMVAMDFDTGVIGFGVNGQWFNNGTSVPDQSFVPATQTYPAFTSLVGPVTMAMWGFAASITASYTIRTKDADFSYKPAGYLSFATEEL